ncbi:MAG TPA: DPP IV N-terminal domain-containing protein, partial [Thermoanaerobaculia bacterium]
MRRLYVCLLTLAVCLPLAAQKKLTLEAIYHPAERVAFGGNSQFGSEWLNDREILWPKRDGTTTTLQLFDVRTGKARPFLDTTKLAAALEAAGLAAPAAKSATARPFFTWDAAKRTLVVTAADDLWHYDTAANRAVRLTSAAGAEELASFSPDGRSVAFVRNDDLYAVDVATQRERALTTGGGPKLLNGKLDWIYQEEIYGRGNFKGYWWSPDSTRIAYLQLDESGVPEYTIVDDIDYRPHVDSYTYPKAGDPNPKAALFVVSAAGGAPVKVDDARYAGAEPLLVDVTWSPSNEVVYQVQNREQTWLDLDRANPATGESRTLLRETTKAWVDVNGSPQFLADGSFLWLSERTGWKHVYHHAANGALIRPVTSGEWEARVLHGVDEKTHTVFFSGTERTNLAVDVYSIALDGTNLKRLSSEAGTHNATFSPGFTHYIDIHSTLATPSQSRVHRRDGSVAQVLDANPVPALAEYGFRAPELVQVKNRDGVVMDATLLKPANFDPSKKYPVFQHTYAGPHIQQVRNAWMGTFGMFHQYLASQGYVVWVLDNTTASGKGGVSAWRAYRNLGETELRDIE